jgi:hypothetical protein
VLRSSCAYSADLRYLAVARGALQSLATHVADPCVPAGIKSQLEHAIFSILSHANSSSQPPLQEASVYRPADRSPVLNFPPAVLSGEALSNADEAARLLADATTLGAPVTAALQCQL